MATPAYVGELQPSSQPQGGSVSVVAGQPAAAETAPPQFLAEIPATVVTATATPPTDQTPPPVTQTTPTQAQNSPVATQPTQTQFVATEIQNSPTQTNAQSTPQYIVVTVTGKEHGWALTVFM